MRTVPAGSFQRLSSFQSLWLAWRECRRGKSRQPRMAEFDLDADTRLLRLHRALATGAYRPAPYRVQRVQDPKTRLIAAPSVRDRVLQVALLAEIGPTYERGFIDQSYAVLRGRGPQRAVLAHLAWMRRCRWRLALDIHHYFASVSHAILLGLFAHRLRDPRTLGLIEGLLAAGGEVYRHPLAVQTLHPGTPHPPGRGLPLGGYLSHWSGGFYLDGLDHYVKRVLKVRGYLRYMDDMVLFGDDRESLTEAREAIRDWLGRERSLALKDPESPVLPNTQPASFLGYRISRAGLAPGPKAKRRLARRLRAAHDLPHAALVRSLAAYRGVWMTL
jgi:RNA-directed DNA polymerase